MQDHETPSDSISWSGYPLQVVSDMPVETTMVLPAESDLLQVTLAPFIKSDELIAGNESLLSNVFSSVQSSVTTGLKWTVAKSYEGASKALKNASGAIITTLGTRRMAITMIASRAKKNELKGEIKFTKEFLSKCSVSGSIENLQEDAELLFSTLDVVKKFEMDLESFYKKELQLLKDITGIKTTEDAISLLHKLDGLEYPSPKFNEQRDSMSTSEVLPGGKYFVFNSEQKQFSVSSDEVSVKENDTSFATEDVVKLLTTINQGVEFFKAFSNANEKYAKYIIDFNTVVGKSYLHLESLKGNISFNLIRDLESRLKGNVPVFAFYSGFLPKVTLYLDDYVGGVTSFLSKQFN
ncbi:hypothetical protein [Aeromonas phage AerS_266]|nr:hypothetical protein [Aeromonas phage AerS_266]